MIYTFKWGSKGIEFQAQLEPKEKRTLYTLKMNSCGFKPTGLCILGERLYEVMISNITLGKVSLTTTPFALSTIQSFKAYVDGRVGGQVIQKGESLSFYLENRGNSRLIVTMFIDGMKDVPRKVVTK